MRTAPSHSWLPALLVSTGIGLAFAPVETSRPLRQLARDVLRPGQTAVRSGTEVIRGWCQTAAGTVPAKSSAPDESEELRAARLALRQYQVHTARLREKVAKLTRQQGLAPTTESPPALLSADLVEARVLGDDSTQLWRGTRMLGAGGKDGVVESALVLESTHPLVDLGHDASLAAGDAVYAGRIVVGKIAEVGRFSSTLRLVTDPGYSGRAQLARRTANGTLVFGAEGTLVADGSGLCRVKHVTTPVNVGDEVFTGGADGALPAPMYYGQVVRAELEPGAQDWSIWVQPALVEERLETVLILRRRVNRDRILAN